MGLDMYLKATKYVGGYEHFPHKEDFTKMVEAAGASKFYDKKTPSMEVSVNVAYWCKSNMIHSWFVENCQGGTDDYGTYPVSREQLVELKDLCQEVITDHSKAQELLPIQQGFFFGSNEYEDWYFQNLEETVNMLDTILGQVPKDWYFEYHASW